MKLRISVLLFCGISYGTQSLAMDAPQSLQQRPRVEKEKVDPNELAKFVRERAIKKKISESDAEKLSNSIGLTYRFYPQVRELELRHLPTSLCNFADIEELFMEDDKRGHESELSTLRFKFTSILREYVRRINVRNNHSVGLKILANYFKKRVLEIGGSQKAADKFAELIWNYAADVVRYDTGFVSGPFRDALWEWEDSIRASEPELMDKLNSCSLVPGNCIIKVIGEKVRFSTSYGPIYYITENGEMVEENSPEK